MMQKIYILGILASREKQCPANLIDISLQRYCNNVWLKLAGIKAKIDVLRDKNNEWRMAA
jgi:hypothetical protein